MRKIASIQYVNAVEPIEGADAIEKIRVLGWWVVTKKGDYKVGDHVVYCEIDSLLPERPEFEFLRPSSFKPARDGMPAGFRIKTVRLRGQVSQGICFPLSILPDGVPLELGTNVAGPLNITKWEPPAPSGMQGRAKGGFPGFLPKTDEVRIQSAEHILRVYQNKPFRITEKLDGTSFTAFLKDDDFGLCSRNLRLDEEDDAHLFVRVSKGLGIKEKLTAMRAALSCNVALQGEVVGPGVQGNKYRLNTHKLYVFNVFNIDKGRYLDHDEACTLCDTLGLETVPGLGSITLNHTVDQLVEIAEDKSVLADVQREGLVFRPTREVYDEELGGRLSFKVINPRFLLKYDE